MPKVSVLILDYCKPVESKMCLDSVHRFCNFDKEILYLSNGGEQDYVWDFYKQGLIDRLILRKENGGSGIGHKELFQCAKGEFSILLQNDQSFYRELNQEMVDRLIYLLKEHPNQQKIGAISLAGLPAGVNTYSERAHFIETGFYNSIPNISDGGVGVHNDKVYSEQSVQEYFKENNLLFLSTTEPFIIDNGKYSIREIGDGKYIHRCDKKTLWVIKQPTYKTNVYPPLNQENGEWDDMLNGKWPVWEKDNEGRIPEQWKAHSFEYWRD